MAYTDPAIAALALAKEADGRLEDALTAGDTSEAFLRAAAADMAAAETPPATWQGAASKLQKAAAGLNAGRIAPDLAPLVTAIAERFELSAPASDDLTKVREIEGYMVRCVEKWGEHVDVLEHVAAVRRWAATPRLVS